MKPCDGCGRSPERCCCPKIERTPCADCGRLLVRSIQDVQRDERGFVVKVTCKDKKRCADYSAAVSGQGNR